MEIAIARQIGQAIRKQRNATGLTQSELAERAHVDRSLIIRIESGEAKSLYPEKLLNVLHALDLKMLIEPNGNQLTTEIAHASTVQANTTQVSPDESSARRESPKPQKGRPQAIQGISEELLLPKYKERKQNQPQHHTR